VPEFVPICIWIRDASECQSGDCQSDFDGQHYKNGFEDDLPPSFESESKLWNGNHGEVFPLLQLRTVRIIANQFGIEGRQEAPRANASFDSTRVNEVTQDFVLDRQRGVECRKDVEKDGSSRTCASRFEGQQVQVKRPDGLTNPRQPDPSGRDACCEERI